MKLGLIGYGTRGDVQPFLCLAWALQRRGHQVQLIAPSNMRSWVERAGVPYSALPVDTHELFAAPEAQRMLAEGRIRAFLRWLPKVESQYLVDMRKALVETTADTDAIITHPLLEDRAAALAAARRVPVIPVYPFPLVPSSELPCILMCTHSVGPLNRLTHRLLYRAQWNTCRRDVETLRRELGVMPASGPYALEVQRRRLPALLAYSSTLVPRPRDYGSNNISTGAITLPNALRARLGEVGVPPELESWLRAGDPPVFLGFGSLPIGTPEPILEVTRAVLGASGRRGLIGAGWSQLTAASDSTLRVVSDIDHDAVLPRCAAAVHHGGAGTTHASLRAGRPTLVCSVFADQPFWGARVRALGAGDTLRFARLDRARLQHALQAVLKPRVLDRAHALAAALSAEDGLGRAVEAIEREVPRSAVPN